MYKAIRDTIIIGNICFSRMSLGMNRDLVMRNWVSKEAIPMLALDNYVINVPTAYQAFYKEAHLADRALKNMKDAAYMKIKGINDKYRSSLLKDGGAVYRLNTSRIRNRMMNPAREFQFRRISLTYNMKEDQSLSATMKIKFFYYCIFQSKYQSQKYFVKEYFIKDIAPSSRDQVKYLLLKKRFARYLQSGKLHIELCSSYDHSDWIKVSIPSLKKKTLNKRLSCWYHNRRIRLYFLTFCVLVGITALLSSLLYR